MQTVDIILIVINCLAIVFLFIFLLLRKKQNAPDVNTLDYQERLNSKLTENILFSIKQYNDSVNQNLLNISNLSKDNIKDIIENQDKLLKSNADQLEKATNILKQGLDKMQSDNSLQLDKMRQTVDEKLNESLQTRLNQSFEMISKRLQDVYEGLGEMKTLATGVGDLKKVLTNVKTRGGWGEVQLGALLEQMLAPNQYKSQVSIKKNSLERVDFAVIIPSQNDTEMLLPIDSKFPLEDYERLVAAYESGNSQEIETQSKNIEKRIKDEAKQIKEKYINPPQTTDFAYMYLPVEGLYAEVLRKPNLTEYLQRNYKIIVCGPTTISAMLNMLQLGFRTITIEKRSTEIWNLLGTFKHEFGKFVALLEKTQNKLNEASKTIEDATKKSKTIEKKLQHVSSDVVTQNELLEIESQEILSDDSDSIA